jgi:hypothetical protein
MNKELKIRENETLDEWCSRIAYYLADTKEKFIQMKEIIREVSVTSYIHGSNDALKVKHRL